MTPAAQPRPGRGSKTDAASNSGKERPDKKDKVENTHKTDNGRRSKPKQKPPASSSSPHRKPPTLHRGSYSIIPPPSMKAQPILPVQLYHPATPTVFGYIRPYSRMRAPNDVSAFQLRTLAFRSSWASFYRQVKLVIERAVRPGCEFISNRAMREGVASAIAVREVPVTFAKCGANPSDHAMVFSQLLSHLIQKIPGGKIAKVNSRQCVDINTFLGEVLGQWKRVSEVSGTRGGIVTRSRVRDGGGSQMVDDDQDEAGDESVWSSDDSISSIKNVRGKPLASTLQNQEKWASMWTQAGDALTSEFDLGTGRRPISFGRDRERLKKATVDEVTDWWASYVKSNDSYTPHRRKEKKNAATGINKDHVHYEDPADDCDLLRILKSGLNQSDPIIIVIEDSECVHFTVMTHIIDLLSHLRLDDGVPISLVLGLSTSGSMVESLLPPDTNARISIKATVLLEPDAVVMSILELITFDWRSCPFQISGMTLEHLWDDFQLGHFSVSRTIKSLFLIFNYFYESPLSFASLNWHLADSPVVVTGTSDEQIAAENESIGTGTGTARDTNTPNLSPNENQGDEAGDWSDTSEGTSDVSDDVRLSEPDSDDSSEECRWADEVEARGEPVIRIGKYVVHIPALNEESHEPHQQGHSQDRESNERHTQGKMKINPISNILEKSDLPTCTLDYQFLVRVLVGDPFSFMMGIDTSNVGTHSERDEEHPSAAMRHPKSNKQENLDPMVNHSISRLVGELVGVGRHVNEIDATASRIEELLTLVVLDLTTRRMKLSMGLTLLSLCDTYINEGLSKRLKRFTNACRVMEMSEVVVAASRKSAQVVQESIEVLLLRRRNGATGVPVSASDTGMDTSSPSATTDDVRTAKTCGAEAPNHRLSPEQQKSAVERETNRRQWPMVVRQGINRRQGVVESASSKITSRIIETSRGVHRLSGPQQQELAYRVIEAVGDTLLAVSEVSAMMEGCEPRLVDGYDWDTGVRLLSDIMSSVVGVRVSVRKRTAFEGGNAGVHQMSHRGKTPHLTVPGSPRSQSLTSPLTETTTTSTPNRNRHVEGDEASDNHQSILALALDVQSTTFRTPLRNRSSQPTCGRQHKSQPTGTRADRGTGPPRQRRAHRYYDYSTMSLGVDHGKGEDKGWCQSVITSLKRLKASQRDKEKGGAEESATSLTSNNVHMGDSKGGNINATVGITGTTPFKKTVSSAIEEILSFAFFPLLHEHPLSEVCYCGKPPAERVFSASPNAEMLTAMAAVVPVRGHGGGSGPQRVKTTLDCLCCKYKSLPLTSIKQGKSLTASNQPQSPKILQMDPAVHLTPTMEDVTVLYRLYERCGRTIQLWDLMCAFARSRCGCGWFYESQQGTGAGQIKAQSVAAKKTAAAKGESATSADASGISSIGIDSLAPHYPQRGRTPEEMAVNRRKWFNRYLKVERDLAAVRGRPRCGCPSGRELWCRFALAVETLCLLGVMKQPAVVSASSGTGHSRKKEVSGGGKSDGEERAEQDESQGSGSCEDDNEVSDESGDEGLSKTGMGGRSTASTAKPKANRGTGSGGKGGGTKGGRRNNLNNSPLSNSSEDLKKWLSKWKATKIYYGRVWNKNDVSAQLTAVELMNKKACGELRF
eukprot:GHVN01019095.1.p1 GENE.GHVN01019095.1~~GHVN01019095.1.p1  ORF type:complete len:1615 (+),score=395.59 GHVN01019095.1:224-5068(+)